MGYTIVPGVPRLQRQCCPLQTCPEEWEKAIGGSDKSGNEDKDKKEKEEVN